MRRSLPHADAESREAFAGLALLRVRRLEEMRFMRTNACFIFDGRSETQHAFSQQDVDELVTALCGYCAMRMKPACARFHPARRRLPRGRLRPGDADNDGAARLSSNFRVYPHGERDQRSERSGLSF
ncbi:MAG: hypothetical protein ACLTV6_04955 [Christensenellales bacterium]